MFTNLAQDLARFATKLERGESVDTGRLITMVRTVTLEAYGVAPVLERLIKVDDQSVQLESALALGKLRGAAAEQVPALVTLTGHAEPYVAGAAFWALGRVGTPAAIDALIEALKPGQRGNLTFVAGGLGEAGARGAPALETIKRTIRDKTLSESDRGSLRDAMAKIYTGMRSEHQTATLDVGFSDFVPLEHLAGQISLDEFFAPYAVVIDVMSEGLIHEGRFRFTFNSINSELGVRIYGNAAGRSVVVIEADDRWYGAYPTNAFESIATAVTHIYGLDPAATVWIEHYAPSAGIRTQTCREVCMRFNDKAGVFEEPRWQPSATLPALLRPYALEP